MLLRCSTQYIWTTKMRRAPCCVLSATRLPAVLSWGPPKASHSSSQTTSGDTGRIEINAASASGSSFLRLSKFQHNCYASSVSFIFLLHLHGINYPRRAFARRSCHTQMFLALCRYTCFLRRRPVTDLTIYPIMEGSIPNDNLRGIQYWIAAVFMETSVLKKTQH